MIGFAVDFTETARKNLKKMDKKESLFLLSWIEKNLVNTQNPRSIGKPLKGNLRSFWRYRIGDYRIIADIQDKKMIILIVGTSHRKESYR